MSNAVQCHWGFFYDHNEILNMTNYPDNGLPQMHVKSLSHSLLLARPAGADKAAATGGRCVGPGCVFWETGGRRSTLKSLSTPGLDQMC